MKIGDRFDLDKPATKAFVNEVIRRMGRSKDVSQVALTVHCVDDEGRAFALVQFHNNRHLVHVLGA